MKSATESAVKATILPKQKRKTTTIHAKISGRYERKRSAVLETISPQQKRKTTVIHAENSEKVPVTTNAKEGAVFQIILPQQKKGDDDNTR